MPNFRRHLSSAFLFFNKLSLEKKFICKVKGLNVKQCWFIWELSHLDLCCLQKSIIIARGSERDRAIWQRWCYVKCLLYFDDWFKRCWRNFTGRISLKCTYSCIFLGCSTSMIFQIYIFHANVCKPCCTVSQEWIKLCWPNDDLVFYISFNIIWRWNDSLNSYRIVLLFLTRPVL